MRKYYIIIIFSVILCIIYCNETFSELSIDTGTSFNNWTISLAQTESTYKSAKIKLLEEDKSNLIVERKLAVGRYNNAEEFKKTHYYNRPVLKY